MMNPSIPLIFLDIDGVLNSDTWFASLGREPNGNVDDIDPSAVRRLNSLVERTDAKIIISSTWRLFYRRPALQSILSRCGLKSRIAGVTPTVPNGVRGDEIQSWLNVSNLIPGAYSPTGMVILDDDADMAHLSPWLVRTSAHVGLTEEDVDRAVDVIRRPMQTVYRKGA